MARRRSAVVVETDNLSETCRQLRRWLRVKSVRTTVWAHHNPNTGVYSVLLYFDGRIPGDHPNVHDMTGILPAELFLALQTKATGLPTSAAGRSQEFRE